MLQAGSQLCFTREPLHQFIAVLQERVQKFDRYLAFQLVVDSQINNAETAGANARNHFVAFSDDNAYDRICVG
jgi:hypothetical protein